MASRVPRASQVGLCASCAHSRRIESERGSLFWLCQLSTSDPRFPKYPRLPVVSCAGYSAKATTRSSPVIVSEYDPAWPGQFELLCSRVAGALGDLAERIDHVGSTAVPELAAKPIIDVDVLLKSSSDFPAALTKLSDLGYEHRGDLGIPGREAFAAPAGGPAHHLYVCLPEDAEFHRHVLLRDYLRAHPADAKAYGELKKVLAAKYSGDREAYIEGKRTFVEELLARAHAWDRNRQALQEKSGSESPHSTESS
jgi:GrpB-like predicted nucleotidyltransferase (UPF0157 family)